MKATDRAAKEAPAGLTLSPEVEAALARFPEDDPIVALRRQKSKIAITGFTDHRVQAFDLGPEWALFGLNELYRYVPIQKYDLWCEIHDWGGLATETQEQVPPPWPRHVEVLSKGFEGHAAFRGGFPLPVYMQERRGDVGASVRYPKEVVEADLPERFGDYKTSAPAWMLGLCIAARFEEIHLYGVDMATDTEYAQQRPCVEFLLGVAVGRGIKVYLPPTSDILHSFGQYAFGPGEQMALKLQERMAWLQEQHAIYTNQRKEIEKARREKQAELDELVRVEVSRCEGTIHEIIGQMTNTRYLMRSWAVPVAAGVKGPHPDRTQDPRTGITNESILATKAGAPMRLARSSEIDNEGD